MFPLRLTSPARPPFANRARTAISRQALTTRYSVVANNQSFQVSNLFNVEDWVVVVTGGGTGIGLMNNESDDELQISQAFANNGARVYITGRRQHALDTAVNAHGKALAHPKGKIIPVVADITDKYSLESLVKEVSNVEKHVDVLVNNAGVSLGSSTVEKGDESAQALQKELWGEDQKNWEDTYKTNVIGHFFTTVAFIPLLSAASNLRPNHTGSVINTSSMSGITRTTQHHFMYNVSKAADIHLTKLLAQELRRKAVKVRVNSIAPGIFPSEITTNESDEANKSEIPTDESYGEKKGIPAGRPGRDEDMAQAALLLACNEYAYGQILTIDGGYLLEHP